MQKSLVVLQSIERFREEFERKVLDTGGQRQNSSLRAVIVGQLIKLNIQKSINFFYVFYVEF